MTWLVTKKKTPWITKKLNTSNLCTKISHNELITEDFFNRIGHCLGKHNLN